jgi:hypothetical protein
MVDIRYQKILRNRHDFIDRDKVSLTKQGNMLHDCSDSLLMLVLVAHCHKKYFT